MDKLAQYLSEIYERKINVEKSIIIGKIPLYLQDLYEFGEAWLQGYRCLFCYRKDSKFIGKTLKNNLTTIEGYANDYRMVLIFDHLRKDQRAFLLNNKVSFVVPFKQMYLPFAGLILSEEKMMQRTKIETFSTSMQCVYLYLLYCRKDDGYTATEIASAIGYTTMTVSRALKELEAIGLIIVKGNATRKRFYRIEKVAYIKQGIQFLKSPVFKTLYLQELPQSSNLYLAGESAFAELTDLSNGFYEVYALDKRLENKLDKDQNYNDFFAMDRPKIKLELWNYNPSLFAKGNVADIVSVYASLKELHEPRIEKEFNNHIWGEDECEA